MDIIIEFLQPVISELLQNGNLISLLNDFANQMFGWAITEILKIFKKDK